MGNQLIAFPTENTVEEIQSIMGGCPFESLLPNLWFISLFVAKQYIPQEILNPGYVYRVEPISAEWWYDDTLGKTDLLILFKSPDIDRRIEIMKASGLESAYSDIYLPYMVMVRGFPQLTRANKAFVRSMSMSLRSTTHNFQFAAEAVVDTGDVVLHEEGMKHFAERLLR